MERFLSKTKKMMPIITFILILTLLIRKAQKRLYLPKPEKGYDRVPIRNITICNIKKFSNFGNRVTKKM